MNKIINKIFLFLASCLLLLTACTKDEEAPVISGVWLNMVERPIEQVSFAYAGQTVCLRGAHLGDLKRVIVNGTDINLNTLFVYESDANITFQIPTDVNTEGDLIRVVTKWGMADFPFIVRSKEEQPTITKFSDTVLSPGTTLTITGTNLDGAQEVWLPLPFNGQTKCEIDISKENDATTVNVIVPDGVSFANGRCVVVMEKTDDTRNITYAEKVYSAETNFKSNK